MTGDGAFGPSPGQPEIGAKGERLWLNPTYMGHQKSNDAKKDGDFYGGHAGLVVAEGRVFGNFYRPSGEILNESTANRYYPLDKQVRTMRQIDADDVTVAIDAASGKTLWTAVEAGKAINGLPGKRSGFGISPAVAEGRLFVFGALGNLYAYEAASGRKLWETTIEPWHAQANAFKQRCLESKKGFDTYGGITPFKDQNSGLVVVAGVVVAPDGAGGLIGLAAATGEKRWDIPGISNVASTPVTWRHEGKDYLLATGSGKKQDTTSLIDPADGRVVWRLAAGPNRWPAVHDGKVLVLNTRGTLDRKVAGQDPKGRLGLLGGYRLGLTEPKLLWTMEDKFEHGIDLFPDIGRLRRIVAKDGWAFALLGPVGTKSIHVTAIDLATGAATARLPCDEVFSAQPVIVGNRLVVQRDVGHSWDDAGVDIYDIGKPGTLALLGKVGFLALDVAMVTSYETGPEYPLWNGIILMKTREGVAAVRLH